MKPLRFLTPIAVMLTCTLPNLAWGQWVWVGPDSCYTPGVTFRADDSDTAYAILGICPDEGVYRSIDGGQTWSMALAVSEGRALAADPINRDVIYLVCQTEVYKSVDAGETWERKDSGIELHIGDQSLSDIAIRQCYPESVFITMIDLGAAGGLWETTNGGVSWSLADMPARRAVATSASVCGLMYTAAGWAPGHGVHRSLNGGATWDTVLAVTANDVAIDPQDASKVYVADKIVYRSLDGGETWQSIGAEAGLTEHVQIVAVNPANPAVVYAGGGNAMFRSSDHGSTWSAFDDGLSESYYCVNSIAVDGEHGAIILIGTGPPGGVLRRIESLAGTGPKPPGTDSPLSDFTIGPNPFSGLTRTSYRLSEPSRVAIRVYDVTGGLTRVLANEQMSPGVHAATWDGLDDKGSLVVSGIYFIRVNADDRQMIRRVVLLR